MRSALNASGYKTTCEQNFSKPFVRLGIQKKLDAMNTNQMCMSDPLARR